MSPTRPGKAARPAPNATVATARNPAWRSTADPGVLFTERRQAVRRPDSGGLIPRSLGAPSQGAPQRQPDGRAGPCRSSHRDAIRGRQRVRTGPSGCASRGASTNPWFAATGSVDHRCRGPWPTQSDPASLLCHVSVQPRLSGPAGWPILTYGGCGGGGAAQSAAGANGPAWPGPWHGHGEWARG